MIWPKRIIAALVGLAAGTLVSELSLRFSNLDQGRRSYVGFHSVANTLPIYTKVFRPNQNIELPQEATSCRSTAQEPTIPFTFRTDPSGEILPIRPGRDVIVFAGGSTTECFDVSENRRFPTLVGEILHDRFGLSVSTRNWGVRGHTTQDTLTLLIYRIRYLKPKLLVVMHNINDRSWLMAHGQYEASDDIALSTTELWIHELKCSSTLAYCALQWAQSHRLVPSRFPGDHRSRIATEFQLLTKPAQLFEENLRLIKAFSDALGIELVLMTQALRDDDNDQIRFNQIVRDFCEASQTAIIDLAAAFEGQPSTTFFEDGIHFSSCGSEYAAEVIAVRLHELLANGVKAARVDSPN